MDPAAVSSAVEAINDDMLSPDPEAVDAAEGIAETVLMSNDVSAKEISQPEERNSNNAGTY